MKPPLVVKGDLAAQHLSEVLVIDERLAVQLLGFHRVEERLHVRVVVHLAGRVHALQDAELGQTRAVLERGGLDASVAVEHEADRGRLTGDT